MGWHYALWRDGMQWPFAQTGVAMLFTAQTGFQAGSGVVRTFDFRMSVIALTPA
jgi:hypothetical protein